MLNSFKSAVPFVALAVALAASTASMAARPVLSESRMGTQKGPTIMGLKTTPKRPPKHSMGAITHQSLTTERLHAPIMLHESGQGRLEGAIKLGEKNTPKRAPKVSFSKQ
jgi:hypothetical protein